MLRRDSDGTVICWLRQDALIAYASMRVSDLAKQPTMVASVPDICVRADADRAELCQIIGDLIQMATLRGADLMQITCDPPLFEAVDLWRGKPTKSTFDFRLGSCSERPVTG